jgi:hypothetical protein
MQTISSVVRRQDDTSHAQLLATCADYLALLLPLLLLLLLLCSPPTGCSLTRCALPATLCLRTT